MCHVFVFVSSCWDTTWPGNTGNVIQHIKSDQSNMLTLSLVPIDGNILSEIEKVLIFFLFELIKSSDGKKRHIRNALRWTLLHSEDISNFMFLLIGPSGITFSNYSFTPTIAFILQI